MLRIQRSANSRVVFTLSGRIEAENVKELRQMLALEAEGQQIVLDLRDVTLVNEGAVKFLAGCEADGIKLENCPAYIRRATAHEDQRAGSMSVIEQNVAGADVAAPTETQSAKSRSRKLKYQTSS